MVRLNFVLIAILSYSEFVIAEPLTKNLVSKLKNIELVIQNQINDLNNRAENAKYSVSDNLSGVDADLSELARTVLDSSQNEKELIQSFNQIKERVSYLVNALSPLVIYFRKNEISLTFEQKNLLQNSIGQQNEYLKKNIKIFESLLDKETGGDLNSLDWSIWILSGVTVLLIVYSIRNRKMNQYLKTENEKLRYQLDSKENEFLETKNDLNKIKFNIEQSTSEVENLNHQISSILDKNNFEGSKQFEEQFQSLLDLIQLQKNFIYRAISGASGEETNALVISGLVNFVEDVSAKSKVIHDIAFKTKVLSFNASVEAERAGARGRGFSIVAQEMKRLAEISGNASEEIASLVDRTRRGALILNSQGGDEAGSKLTIQNTLVEASGNIESIQNKINDLNAFVGSMVNQKSVTQSNLEHAYKLVNQITKAQNEIKTLNDGIMYSHNSLAS